MDSSTAMPGRWVKYKIAYESSPSLPARPVSWTYCSISPAGPQWITRRTFGQSSPIPKATVATTTRNLLQDEQNYDKMDSFTDVVVQAQNMSTSRKRAKSTAPTGSVISGPSLDFKNMYIIEQVSYVRQ